MTTNFNDNISKIYGNVVEEGEMIVTDEQLFDDCKPHNLMFKFYDGFGFCENYNGKSYYISFPALNFFAGKDEVKNEVIKNASIEDNEEEKLSPFNIAITFGQICCLDDKSEYQIIKNRELVKNEKNT